MTSKAALKFLFCCIFLALVVYNSWAATQQSMFAWGGLTRGADRYWTIATFLDAYCGFLTFYLWVFYKEARWWSRGRRTRRRRWRKGGPQSRSCSAGWHGLTSGLPASEKLRPSLVRKRAVGPSPTFFATPCRPG